MQSRHRDRVSSPPLSATRGEPASASVCSRWSPTCSPRSVAPTISPTSPARSRRPRDGFISFNLDLIYGGVGETLEDWRRTLGRRARAQAAAHDRLHPHRRSGYAAGRRARTSSRRRRSSGQVPRGGPALGGAGLDAYEISNWARPGLECRHNLCTGRRASYLGVGCAAHSHRQGSRWWNVRTPERYIEAIAAGRHRGGIGDARRRDASARTIAARLADPRRSARRRPSGRPR